jgi:hypothetical protein
MDEWCPIIIDSNDIEFKVVKIVDIQISTKEVLVFMTS